ncbi:MAG: Hachiman antiphage defense system protein HamA [Halobacteriota archaeon]
MMEFDEWCESAEQVVNGHDLKVLSGSDDHLVDAQDRVAAIVPGHYASEEHVTHVLERLGKPAAAEFVRQKLPESKAIRSGDLGEILATEYIAENTPYEVPIKRLRWKDHRNMAMRGDDIIGIEQNPENRRLKFLKSEAKSRAALAAGVLVDARTALEKDGGLPSPHALAFVSERLMETGNQGLADAIDDAQLKDGIATADVEHLLFTFSGNDPTALLQASLQGYGGTIHQHGVGLRIAGHTQFVQDVFEKVMADGDND